MMFFSQHKDALTALCLIGVVWVGILLFHPPRVTQDTLTYVESMNVLKGGTAPATFVPNRILTTYGGMRTILFLEPFVGGTKMAWAFMNSMFFLVANFFFYKIFFEVFGKQKTALIGTILVATNYAMVANAMDYVMDIGGWASYAVALYFSLRYIKTDNFRYGWYGALAIGVGCFFKEYAFLGFITLFCAIIYRNWQRPVQALKKIVETGTVSFLPIFIFYGVIYFHYAYSYANWFSYAQESVGSYHISKITEYIKVFGSLYTFGWIFFLAGLVLVARRAVDFLSRPAMMFILFAGISALPVFVWPFIVQRILFPIIPFLTMVACIAFEKYESKWVYLAPLLVLYVAANYAMDAYVLPWVNIDPLLRIFV